MIQQRNDKPTKKEIQGDQVTNEAKSRPPRGFLERGKGPCLSTPTHKNFNCGASIRNEIARIQYACNNLGRKGGGFFVYIVGGAGRQVLGKEESKDARQQDHRVLAPKDHKDHEPAHTS